MSPALDPFAAILQDATDHTTDGVAQAEIKKAQPPQVDVARRLNDRIAGLEFAGLPLLKAVNMLAAMGSLPVTMDADAMTQLGVAPQEPISLRLEATTVGKVLQAVVAQKGLALVVDGDQVVITAPAEYRQQLGTVRYAVTDLTGDDRQTLDQLAAMVQKLVAPDSWKASGGRGTIDTLPGTLVVTHSGNIQQQVSAFCEKLRSVATQADKQPRRPTAGQLDHAPGPGPRDARSTCDNQFPRTRCWPKC